MMLSVICPIYNEAKYIDVCIQSILFQDYPKDCLEVLFVDGMSKDGTRDIVAYSTDSYEYRDKGVKRGCHYAFGCSCAISSKLFLGISESFGNY